jgi:hypothetical protein
MSPAILGSKRVDAIHLPAQGKTMPVAPPAGSNYGRHKTMNAMGRIGATGIERCPSRCDGRFRTRRPKLCSRHEGVACAVRYDLPDGGKREMVTGNERLVGHDAIEQFAPRRFGKHWVSIDRAVPIWVLRE